MYIFVSIKVEMLIFFPDVIVWYVHCAGCERLYRGGE